MTMDPNHPENNPKPLPQYTHSGQLPDISSLRELPESHAWAPSPAEDKFFPPAATDPHGGGEGEETVPIIDLADANAAEQIGQACRTWGVFHVINHGFPEKLIQEIECWSKRLFSLPMEEKQKAARSAGGSSGYGVAPISSFFPKRMWSEGFTVIGSPSEHASRLWPDDYASFCDVIEGYDKEMKKLVVNLMWLALGSLGVRAEDLEWAGRGARTEDVGSAAIQLNSYPACPEPDRAMGLAAHTDSTILTVLHQSTTSGLQVRRKNGLWVTVPPLAGALVVNAGDLLQILSNGAFPSVIHRAVVNRDNHRYSVAYLFGPPAGVLVSSADSREPPVYRAVTWSEYLGIKGKHFTKALSTLRTSRS